MKLIDISTQKYPNLFTMVDDEDFDFLNQWKWHKTKSGYVTRKKWLIKGKTLSIFLHRSIMLPSDDFVVDHINGDTLDNRKNNLRICTFAQNLLNRKKTKSKGSDKYKGVFAVLKYKRSNLAQIKFKRRCYPIGRFACQNDAATAYNIMACILFGEFAKLNLVIT